MPTYAPAPAVFWLTFVIMTVFLFWLVKQVIKSLNLQSMLSEKERSKVTTDREVRDDKTEKVTTHETPVTGDTSFSRVAGAVGMSILTALFLGVSYWVLWTLFNDGKLDKLNNLGYSSSRDRPCSHPTRSIVFRRYSSRETGLTRKERARMANARHARLLNRASVDLPPRPARLDLDNRKLWNSLQTLRVTFLDGAGLKGRQRHHGAFWSR